MKRIFSVSVPVFLASALFLNRTALGVAPNGQSLLPPPPVTLRQPILAQEPVTPTPLPSASSNDCVPPPAGIISWWKGDDNTLDSAGTNDGVNQNVTYTNGVVGQAFAFDGDDSGSSYIKIPASPSLDVGQSNGFTLEFWCNPATTNAPGAGVMTLAEWNNNSGTLNGIGCHLEF
jgi:hypothetical protein